MSQTAIKTEPGITVKTTRESCDSHVYCSIKFCGLEPISSDASDEVGANPLMFMLQ